MELGRLKNLQDSITQGGKILEAELDQIGRMAQGIDNDNHGDGGGVFQDVGGEVFRNTDTKRG